MTRNRDRSGGWWDKIEMGLKQSFVLHLKFCTQSMRNKLAFSHCILGKQNQNYQEK